MNKKVPKGTIDLYDKSFEQISFYKKILENLFISYGGVGLETPVFEIRDNLLGKYGDEAETKLVFNLENCKTEQGEKYTLRYDLTIPKVRFIQSKNIQKGRIYSIGKVYRRDNPSLGRYREFYQADFDIVGEDSDTMINEFLMLKLATEFLRENGVTNFTILINDTNYLKYLLVDELKIEESMFKQICSSIDKLDKCEFKDIVSELTEKGLSSEQILTLEEFLKLEKPKLEETSKRINTIIDYANTFDFGDKIVFTSSLARGLDYYNGIIYEIKLPEYSQSTVISGGRYDGAIPSKSLIGISFGLSRMADLLEFIQEQWKEVYYLTNVAEVDMKTKFEILKRCETKFNKKMMVCSEETDKKLIKTIGYCLANKIRYLVILGDELKDNKVVLKDLKENIQTLVDL